MCCELLAVMAVLEHFQPYCMDKPSCYSLIWLLSFKNPDRQLAHWIEQLQDYSFTIQFRSCMLMLMPCLTSCAVQWTVGNVEVPRSVLTVTTPSILPDQQHRQHKQPSAQIVHLKHPSRSFNQTARPDRPSRSSGVDPPLEPA